MILSLRAENPRWLPVDFSSPVAPACPLLAPAGLSCPPLTRFGDLGLSHTVSVPGDGALGPLLLPI